MDRRWRRWEGGTRKVGVGVKEGSVCFGAHGDPRRILAPQHNVGWGILFFDPTHAPLASTALHFWGPVFAISRAPFLLPPDKSLFSGPVL